MKGFNDKSIKVLATLLLSDKPLNTTEIAKKTLYWQFDIEFYKKDKLAHEITEGKHAFAKG